MSLDEEERQVRSVALQNASAILRERERVERELAEQREKLRITLLSIADGVISTTADGRIDLFNPVAEKLTGWAHDDAVGRPLAEVFRIVHETTRAEVPNPALEALKQRRPMQLANHTMLIARDGSERPIDDSAAPILGPDGAVVGAVLVFRDVSARRRDDEIRLRLAAIVESSQDAIVSKTLDGIIRSWNDSAERLFGWKAAEIIGKPVTTLIPKDRLDEERLILSRLAKGERVDHFDTVRVAKDGRLLDISLTVSPIRNAEGQIIGASKIARDITAQKRAEATAQEAGRRLGIALEAARLGDWSWDLATDAVVFSRRASEVFGQPPGAELSWARMQEVIHPDDRDAVRLATEHAIATRGDYDAEYRVQRSDGAVVWVSAKGRAQYGNDGKAVSMLGVVQDITDRKRLEHELKANADELAHVDRQKDDFIALLAHELRNPLAPIRNGLHVMRLAGDDLQKIASAREVMDRQLKHMVRLIDDLLDISRVNRNKLHLQKRRVLLAEVMNHAVETARPLIDAARHQLTVSLPEEPVSLEADLTRVSQIISNLLTNSAKYTERGGLIALAAVLEGGSVAISVKDNGIGIPEAALPRVFDMFAQVDRPIEQATGGLGIGLALVKGLAEAHGGSVAAMSEGPGRGSTFIVRLPVLPSAPPAPRPSAPVSAPRAAASRRLRVVVADDNLDGAESMGDLLEMLGNEVHLAHDGERVVALAEQLKPDLILMDVGMPKLNGLDATRKIRAQPWGQGISIVALTGWGKDSDRERSKEAGCNGHLVKPVGVTQLEDLIAQVAGPPVTGQ